MSHFLFKIEKKKNRAVQTVLIYKFLYVILSDTLRLIRNIHLYSGLHILSLGGL